jgi:hypothetical protein
MSQHKDKTDADDQVERMVVLEPDCEVSGPVRIRAMDYDCQCVHCGESSVDFPLRSIGRRDLEIDGETYPNGSFLCEECWELLLDPLSEFYEEDGMYAVCLAGIAGVEDDD